MITRRAAWRLGLLLVFIAATTVLAVTVGLPTPAELQAGFARLGAWAVVVFLLGYAVATLSPLPKSLFTLAAGALFGVPVGLLVVLAGATGGAVVAFHLARGLGREGVHRFTGDRFDRLEERLDRHGFLTVLVARLVPVVPFTAVNYLAGLTAMSVRVFVLGTVVGITPASTMYVVLGAYGGEPGSWPFRVALVSLGVLTVVGVAGAIWRRRHESRVVSVDTATVVTLRRHRAVQVLERNAGWGPAWNEAGLVFTREDGRGLRPQYATKHVAALAGRLGCRSSELTTCAHPRQRGRGGRSQGRLRSPRPFPDLHHSRPLHPRLTGCQPGRRGQDRGRDARHVRCTSCSIAAARARNHRDRRPESERERARPPPHSRRSEALKTA